MKKIGYLANVGFIGLAAGLMAAPASANEGETAEEVVALEAQGTFVGFNLTPRLATSGMAETVDLRDYMVRHTVNATPVPPSPELIVRDDIGIDGAVDVDNTLPSVVQMFIADNATGGVFFNCTGTVINPRTILTAAHCLNSRPSEAYGDESAAFSVLIGTGVDTAPRIFGTIGDGLTYSEGGAARSTDVIIHASANQENGALPFPWADIALIAVDEPITDVPAMPVLLSPLTELQRVVQVGYGTNGTGLQGAIDTGSPFLRRFGENQLGLSGSLSDFIDAGFPGFTPSAETLGFESQVFYWTDFDNPDRTPEESAGCTFTGTGIDCADIPSVLAIDWFDGDALPLEAGTAPGDSGSPLIATGFNIPGPGVVTAVLSGGFDFFGLEPGNFYGDVSFYNPLFPFFEFITENTPYKYVSARKGSGRWSDPHHWTQDLDPGFLIDDGNGNLVNGVPSGPEPGVYEQGPKFGTVLGQDISGFAEVQTPILPPEGTPGFGTNTPNSSVLLGPGSTGFVPNNTDGTVGTAFDSPAQYFDVFLSRPGRTLVDIDVVIDKLSLDNRFAAFDLRRGRELTAIIGYEQFNGVAEIDGTLNAGVVGLFGGVLQGKGVINTSALFNLGAAISPDGLFRLDTLTINGDYIQGPNGALVSTASFSRKRTQADLLLVNGDAELAGDLFVLPLGRAKFADEFAVLSANSITGEFDNTNLITFSPLLFAESRVEGGDVIVTINALSLRDLFQGFGNLASLGEALDTIRFGGNFTQASALFDMIDGSTVDTLIPTLNALTPVSAFTQSTMATNFSQRFTSQIGQRTLSLRGANNAAAAFNPAGGAGFALAQTNPVNTGDLGFFSTISGTFLVSAQERSTGQNALEEASFMQGGELTIGADMRVADDFAVGFAMTSVRNGAASLGAQQGQGNTSVSGAVYAAKQFGAGFADAYVGFARQNFGVERASAGEFARAFDSAMGNAEGSQSFAGMRVGYGFEVLPGLETGPVASFDYVRSNLNGYQEYGAGLFGLNVADRTFTSMGSKAGWMASLDTGIGGGIGRNKARLTAFGSVAYARELADTRDAVTASFLLAPEAAFTIVNQIDPEWVSVNAGADFALNDRFMISVTGTSDLGRGILSNDQGRVTLNWRW